MVPTLGDTAPASENGSSCLRGAGSAGSQAAGNVTTIGSFFSGRLAGAVDSAYRQMELPSCERIIIPGPDSAIAVQRSHILIATYQLNIAFLKAPCLRLVIAEHDVRGPASRKLSTCDLTVSGRLARLDRRHIVTYATLEVAEEGRAPSEGEFMTGLVLDNQVKPVAVGAPLGIVSRTAIVLSDCSGRFSRRSREGNSPNKTAAAELATIVRPNTPASIFFTMPSLII